MWTTSVRLFVYFKLADYLAHYKIISLYGHVLTMIRLNRYASTCVLCRKLMDQHKFSPVEGSALASRHLYARQLQVISMSRESA